MFIDRNNKLGFTTLATLSITSCSDFPKLLFAHLALFNALCASSCPIQHVPAELVVLGR